MENKFDKVAIYVVYHDLNLGHAMEELIKQYCDDKNYTITKIYRLDSFENDSFIFTEDTWRMLSETIGIFDSNNLGYDKVIFYSLEDISFAPHRQLAFVEVMYEFGISVETLKEGIINDDCLFGVTVNKNVKQKHHLTSTFNPYLLKKDQSINVFDAEFQNEATELGIIEDNLS